MYQILAAPRENGEMRSTALALLLALPACAAELKPKTVEGFDVYIRETEQRLPKKKVITVVLSTEHDVKYTPVDKNRWRSVSRSTKIAEVDKAGKPEEREKPPGTGEGFLWKLNSYWRFEERDGGVWVECEAISLTRNVPTGLGWVVEPIIRDLPKESLANTLRSTRNALANPSPERK